MASIADLQDRYLAKLASKTRGTLNKHAIATSLKEWDSDGDGCISLREFLQALERAGNPLNANEASALFSFWDTRAGQQDPVGLVPIGLAAEDLAASQEQFSGNVFRSGDTENKGGAGNKSNRPSQQGGIFGGGAFEADSRGVEYARQPAPCGRPMGELATQSSRPKGNEPSIAGGIFGEADGAAPTNRGGGNKSNRSSVDGGIFAMPNEPQLMQRGNKPYSNASSIPGGIFG